MNFSLPSLIYLSLFLLVGPTTISAQSLRFEQNKGQLPEQVLADAKMHAARVFIERDGVRLNYFHPEDYAELFSHQHHEHHHGSSSSRTVQENLMRAHTYKVNFLQANSYSVRSEEQLPGVSNYFLGSNPDFWASGVVASEEVVLEQVWNGINIRYNTLEQHLHYQFEVDSGFSAEQIQLEYLYTDGLRLNAKGELEIQLSVNTITETNLYAYQEIEGDRKEVLIEWNLKGNIVEFIFPEGYNKQYPLIIDPQLVASTYTGSTADNFGYTATYGQDGSILSAGSVFGNGYPTSNGAYDNTFSGADNTISDIGVTKFTPDATQIVYSTYIGGTGAENPNSIIEAPNGELAIIGVSSSTNYPTTVNAFDRTFNGGTARRVNNNQAFFDNGTDIVLTVLSANGDALIGSTYFGGSLNDGINDDLNNGGIRNPLYHNYNDIFRGEVIVDSFNNIIFTSSSFSDDLPVSAGAHSGGLDAVYGKFNLTLSNLEFASYFGTPNLDAGFSIKESVNGGYYMVGGTNGNTLPQTAGALNPNYLGGTADGYLTKISATGQIQATTYLGQDNFDLAYFVDVDVNDNPYVFGVTTGTNFPHTAGVVRQGSSGQFVIKLDPGLGTNLLSTTYGKADADPDISPTAFLVDDCENLYFAGFGGATNNIRRPSNDQEFTNNLPISPDAQFPTTDGSDFHFYVLKREATEILYATYFGGNETSDHVDGGTSRFDSKGIAYHAVCASCGNQQTGDVPTTAGAHSNIERSPNCNLAVFKFEFEILVRADADVLPTDTGCVPFTVNFINNSTTGSVYEWDFGDGTTSTEFEPSHTFTDTGTYSVRLIAVDSLKCNIQDTAYVDITVIAPSELPNIEFVVSDTCDNINIVGNAINPDGAEVEWNVDGNTVFGNTFDLNFNTPGEIPVNLTATFDDLCGSVFEFDTSFFFDPYELDLAVDDTSFLNCDSIFIQAASLSQFDSTTQYEWFVNGVSSSVDSTFDTTFFNAGAYELSLIVTDTNACNLSDTLVFNYEFDNTPVELQATFDTLESCIEEVLYVDGSSNSGNPIIWDFGNGTTSSQSPDTNIYSVAGSYTIRAIITDSSFCNLADTVEYQLVFDTSTIQFDSAISIQNICTEIQIEGLISNFQGQISWLVDGTEVGIDTNLTYSSTEEGEHLLEVILTDSSTCNIQDTLSLPFEFSADSLEASPLFNINQNCDSMVVNGEFVGDADAIQWNLGSGNSTTNPMFEETVFPNGLFTYQLIITDSAFCNITDTFEQIIDYDTSSIDLAADFSFENYCDSFIVFVENRTDSARFYWDFGNGDTSNQNTTSYTYYSEGEYTVSLIVNDSLYCNLPDSLLFPVNFKQDSLEASAEIIQTENCDSLAVQIIGEGSPDWQHFSGDGRTSIGQTAEFIYTIPGTYTIQSIITDTAFCNISDTVSQEIEFDNIPFTLVSDTSILNNCSSILVNSEMQAASDSSSFEWIVDGVSSSVNASFDTTFSVSGQYSIIGVLTDSTFCNKVDSVEYIVDFISDSLVLDPRWVFMEECDSAVVLGEIDSGFAFVEWTLSTGAVSNEDAISETLLENGQYSYSLIVSDSAYCNLSDTVFFEVEYDTSRVELNPDYTVENFCDSIVLIGENINPGGVYQWNFGDGTSSTQRTIKKVYTQAGDYPVLLVVRDSLSCYPADTLSFLVEFELDSIVAENTLSTIESCDSLFVDIQSNQFGNWQHFISDGRNFEGENVQFSFYTSGTVTVQSVFIDSAYCNIADTITRELEYDNIPFILELDSTLQNNCSEFDVFSEISSASDQSEISWFLNDVLVSDTNQFDSLFTIGGEFRVQGFLTDTSFCNNLDSVEFSFQFSPDSLILDPEMTYFRDCDSAIITGQINDEFSFFEWTLGGGGTSQESNIREKFIENGVYSYSLIAVDSAYCNISDTFLYEVKYDTARIVLSSEYTTENFCDSLVLFAENTTSDGRYYWDFGDGTISTDRQVEHVYRQSGTYDVKLVVNDSLFCNLPDSIEFSVSFSSGDLVTSADFSTIETCDSIFLEINAQPQTEEWAWDLGDGTIDSSFSISKSYLEEGDFSISGILVDSSFCNIADTQRFSVSLDTNQIRPDFTILEENDCGKYNFKADYFGNPLADDAIIEWRISDGRRFETIDLDIIFNEPGVYQLTVTVTDTNYCNTSFTEQYEIDFQLSPLDPSIRIEPDLSCDSLKVIAYNTSSQSTGISWDFGDGETDAADTVEHIYDVAGEYTIIAYILDTTVCPAGDSLSRTITIEDEPFNIQSDFDLNLACNNLQADFIASPSGRDWDYTWDFGDGDQAIGDSVSHRFRRADSFIVQLIVSDEFNCNLADTTEEVVVIRTELMNPEIEQVQLASCDPIQVQFFNRTQTVFDRIEWKFSNGVLATSDSVLLELENTEEIIATLVIYDSLNCNQVDSIQALVQFDTTVLDINANVDSRISCENYSVQLNPEPQGLDSYSWIFSDGDSSTIQNVIHEFPGPGTYTVQLVVEDSEYCNQKDSIEFEVQFDDSPILAEFEFIEQVDCDSLIVELTNTSENAEYYIWDFGDGTSSTEQNPIKVYQEAGVYTIQLIASDSFNCNRADTFELPIQYQIEQPEVEVIADPIYDCEEFNADFSVESTLPANFEWAFEDGELRSEPAFTKTFSEFGDQVYTLFVSDQLGCDTTEYPGKLSLLQDTVNLDLAIDFQLACPDFLVAFEANTSEEANVTWFFNSDTLFGSEVEYNFPSAGAWPIEVFAIDSQYCEPLNRVIDTLEFTDEPLNIGFDYVPDNRCDSLIARFENFSDTVDTYLWDFGNGTFSNERNPTKVYYEPGVFEVVLTISDSSNCNPDLSSSTELVFNGDSVLSSLDFTPNILSCDEFRVEFNSLATGYEDLIWKFGDGGIDSTENPVHRFPGPGTYTIQLIALDITACNIADTIETTIELRDEPIDYAYTFTPDGVCDSFTVDLEAQSSSETMQFVWDMGDGNEPFISFDTTYRYDLIGFYDATIYAIDSFNCQLADTSYFVAGYADDSIVASFDFVTDINCDRLIVEATNTSINGVQFDWDFGDGNTAQGPTIIHQYNEYGTYTITLIVTDTFICKPIDTATAVVDFPPPLEVDFSAPVLICENEEVEFENNSVNVETYSWDFGDGTSSNDFEPSHYYEPGEYTVRLIGENPNSCNLIDSAFRIVSIEEQDVFADFDYTPKEAILIQTPIEFLNMSIGASSYKWDFGDGQSSVEEHPIHRYQSNEVFEACLEARGLNTCRDTICKTILVNLDGNIDIPNAFSPDGDNVNDILFVRAFGAVEINLKIFNRWGEFLFETNDLSIGWDGTWRGEPQEMEVYVYILSGTLNNGRKIFKKGNVTLLR